MPVLSKTCRFARRGTSSLANILLFSIGGCGGLIFPLATPRFDAAVVVGFSVVSLGAIAGVSSVGAAAEHNGGEDGDAHTTSSPPSPPSPSSPSSSSDQTSCGLYLAPSSTNPEEDEDLDYARHPPKIGLYAGRDYAPHETIGYPEIAIQIYDMEGHTGRSAAINGIPFDDDDDDERDVGYSDDENDDNDANVNYFRFAMAQLWTPDSTGAKYDTSEFSSDGTVGDGVAGPGHTYTVIPGVGMMSNFHPGITNADWDQSSCRERTPYADDASARASAFSVSSHLSSSSSSSAAAAAARSGNERAGHPGRGASSHYYNVTVRSTRHIPAGMEIFLDFGSEWSKENTPEGVPTKEDYDRADDSVDAVLAFLDRYASSLTPELSSDIYDFLLNEVVPFGSESEIQADMARSLLPKDVSKLRSARDTGGSLRNRNPSVFRDVSWLQEHGQCADNIRPGPSTIPYAGRGAFASRRIGKGEVISPMPLVHIPNMRELDTYDLEVWEYADASDPDYKPGGLEALARMGGRNAKPVGKQLLLNYCFGHPDSTILLYPFGTASNFINHQPGGRANAKIVWSSSFSSSFPSYASGRNDKGGEGGKKRGRVKGPRIHRPEWLDVSPEELNEPTYDYVGLAFDLIALRDIRPEEEVFLDYGAEWSGAWEDHARWWEVTSEVGGGGDGASVGGGGSTVSSDPTALELDALYHGRWCPDSGDGEKGGKRCEILPFRTMREAKERPYPNRVTTACHVGIRESERGSGGASKREEWYIDEDGDGEAFRVYQWTDDPSLGIEDGEGGERKNKREKDVWKGESMRLCKIVSRVAISEEGSGGGGSEASPSSTFRYTAMVILEEALDGLPAGTIKVVSGIPHSAVRFVDKPYYGDQHRKGAFRHWIGIPDEIFPDAWRNRGSAVG